MLTTTVSIYFTEYIGVLKYHYVFSFIFSRKIFQKINYYIFVLKVLNKVYNSNLYSFFSILKKVINYGPFKPGMQELLNSLHLTNHSSD